MADKKISALTAATTPLAGSEVLPIVQGGSTVKVSIANVTAGRDVGAKNVIATGQGVFAGPLDNFWSASGALYGYYSGGGVFGSYSDAVGTLSPLSFDGSTIALRTANVSRLEVSNGGNVTARTGNLVMGTAGRGIDFSANGGDVLTQYDEGTFTPVVEGSVSAGTATYSVQVGRYTRIGNRVLFNLTVVYSGHTGTGVLYVTGLPFNSADIANTDCPVSVYLDGITLTSLNVPQTILYRGTKIISLQQYPVGGGAASGVPMDAAGEIRMSGSYQV